MSDINTELWSDNGEEEERARKVRKGFKYCRGHGIAHPLAEFSTTSGNNCIPVKKIMDSVWKQASVQGELGWYKLMRLSDRKMKQVVEYFNLQETTKRGGKTFLVCSFREFHKAEQAVDFVEKGKMMWEREAIEFWMSTAGGNLDLDSAQLRWDDMSAHWKERRIPQDMRGPNPKKTKAAAGVHWYDDRLSEHDVARHANRGDQGGDQEAKRQSGGSTL